MGLEFHWVPARNGHTAQDALNAALRTLRIVSVEKHFCALPPDPGWAVCVEYTEEDASPASGRMAGRKDVDYKELLDPETFAIFAALRETRKELAAQEGAPIYAIMTNEQLAEVARRRCQTVAEIGTVKGLGPARAGKHGPRMIEALRRAVAEQSQQEGKK